MLYALGCGVIWEALQQQRMAAYSSCAAQKVRELQETTVGWPCVLRPHWAVMQDVIPAQIGESHQHRFPQERPWASLVLVLVEMMGVGLQGCASGCRRPAARVKLDAMRPALAHIPACAQPACRASSPVRAQAQDALEPEQEHPRGIFETYPQSAETVTILDARRVPPAQRQVAKV